MHREKMQGDIDKKVIFIDKNSIFLQKALFFVFLALEI
jgi:hypothetical protein